VKLLIDRLVRVVHAAGTDEMTGTEGSRRGIERVAKILNMTALVPCNAGFAHDPACEAG
jgi:hypothetical protein